MGGARPARGRQLTSQTPQTCLARALGPVCGPRCVQIRMVFGARLAKSLMDSDAVRRIDGVGLRR